MQGFVFGGDTGISYEDLQRRRAVAEAMALRRGGTPRNMWEGLDSATRSVAGALMARNLDAREQEQRESASEAFQRAIGGIGLGGAPVAPETAPAVPAAAPAAAPGAQEWSPELIQSVIAAESGGNPAAVSPKGAGGLMQIMPDTARDPGYGVPNIYQTAEAQGLAPPPADATDEQMTAWLADPANVGANKAFGEAYLKAMVDAQGGDVRKGLAAYNAGPGAVQQHGGVPPFAETQAYVDKIAGPAGGSVAVAQNLPKPGAQPAPQAAPGVGRVAQALNPELVAALSSPYLSDGQRMVGEAIVKQQLAAMYPERMSPYQQEQVRLANERLALDRGKAASAAAGGAGKYGLTPIYGQDADGNTVIMQMNDQGGIASVDLPEGTKVGKDPIRIDAGTATILLDPVTRQVIGQIDKDIRGEAREKNIGSSEGEKAAAAPGAIAQAEAMLADIDAVLGDEQLGNATGWGSYIPFDIPGFNAETRSRINKLQGQAFMQAYEGLRGGGQITEVEGKKAEQAIARLNTAQSEEEFRTALTELRGVVERGLERSRGLVGGEPSVDATAPAAPAAPVSDDDLFKKYGIE